MLSLQTLSTILDLAVNLIDLIVSITSGNGVKFWINIGRQNLRTLERLVTEYFRLKRHLCNIEVKANQISV